jgi:tRNA(adenine34) deaminase
MPRNNDYPPEMNSGQAMPRNNSNNSRDEHFMKEAIREAGLALAKDEVPVGAVIVNDNKIIARSHNLSERLTDPTAHAEMQALTSACHHLNSKYLKECTLYVTLEPCIMCAGATFWTQIGRIVVGAPDPKRGFRTISAGILHPKTKYAAGVLEAECADLLRNYFKLKRKAASMHKTRKLFNFAS